MATTSQFTPAQCATPKTPTMEPNMETDSAPEDSESAIMEKMNQILRKSVDNSPRIHSQFSPTSLMLLVIYTLIQIAFIQQVSLLLSCHFLVLVIFMLLVEGVAELQMKEVVEGYEKFIDGMREVAQISLATAQICEKAAQKSGVAFNETEAYRTTEFRMFHQQANEMRLGYYQAYSDHYETLVHHIELIAKKVKTLATPPKVKGARRNGNNRNKNNNNALAEPLEKFAVALKQRQSMTRVQIAVVEKIKDILDREDLLPEEIDRLLNEAEADLERAQQASNAQTRSPGCGTFNSIASPPPVAESVDSKLEKHYKDLDRWLQSVRDRPVVVEEN